MGRGRQACQQAAAVPALLGAKPAHSSSQGGTAAAGMRSKERLLDELRTLNATWLLPGHLNHCSGRGAVQGSR